MQAINFRLETGAIFEGNLALDSPFPKEYFWTIRFRLFPINPSAKPLTF
jgi:hypothetical protein